MRTTLCLLALLCTVAGAAAAQRPTAIASIPGPDGGWDYASVSPETGRLYVAHGDTVATVDLARPDRATKLAPAHHAHMVLPLPGGAILVTDGDTATARILDGRTGAQRASIAVGDKPDAAIWDAKRGRAIVMNGRSGTLSVIDPVAARVTATIALAPHLEFAAIDRRGLLYVNDEERNRMFVVDLDAAKPVAEIALPGCDGPTGLAYAPRADRLVAACGNAVAAIVDPVSRRLTGTLAIGEGADAVIGDPARARLFVPAGGDGTLTVLEDRAGGVMRLAAIATEKAARTGAVDPRTGIVYLPTAGLAPAKTGGRGTPIAGSFHILAVTPGTAR